MDGVGRPTVRGVCRGSRAVGACWLANRHLRPGPRRRAQVESPGQRRETFPESGEVGHCMPTISAMTATPRSCKPHGSCRNRLWPARADGRQGHLQIEAGVVVRQRPCLPATFELPTTSCCARRKDGVILEALHLTINRALRAVCRAHRRRHDHADRGVYSPCEICKRGPGARRSGRSRRSASFTTRRTGSSTKTRSWKCRRPGLLPPLLLASRIRR